jgi:predicted transcriptional regulator YdeE
VTKKVDDQYFYLTAIPKLIEVAGFSGEELKVGEYMCFEHRGHVGLLKSTVNNIYKKVIPESDFHIDENRTSIHHEQYDRRFLWNKPSSLICIYLPVKNT